MAEGPRRRCLLALLLVAGAVQAQADTDTLARQVMDTERAFARSMAERKHADFTALHAHGFTDDDIWDIGNITALFALSNRMANVTGLMPNTEFYTMGRMPK